MRSGRRMIARVAWAIVVAPVMRCRLMAMFRKGGHDLRGRPSADLGPVFVEGDVAHVVDPVLDGPVPADDLGELGWFDLVEVEVGEGVDGLGLDLAAARSTSSSHADGLPGVRERQPSRRSDHLDRAGLDTTMTGVRAGEGHVHVLPRQCGELAAQRGAVAFDVEDVVRPTPVSSRWSSRGTNAVISLDLASTATCPRTTPVLWSTAATRCTGRPSGLRPPRALLASTARQTSPCSGWRTGARVASHAVRTASSRSDPPRAPPGGSWPPRAHPGPPRTAGAHVHPGQ